MTGSMAGVRIVLSPRVTVYQPVLTRVSALYCYVTHRQIRATLISKMAKPEEVLVVENDNGEVCVCVCVSVCLCVCLCVSVCVWVHILTIPGRARVHEGHRRH